MTKFTVITAAIGALAVTALGLAGGAAAIPTGGSTAADTVSSLQDQGYNVQFNGTATAPLSRCTVTGIHGLLGTQMSMDVAMMTPRQFDTVYVDLSCPPTNN
jgi:hypothetical protein